MTDRRSLLVGMTLAASATFSRPAAAGPACGVRSRVDAKAATPGSLVTLADTDCFDMRAASGVEYRIKTAWPSPPQPCSGGFPLIVLLDGGDYFEMLVEMARMLAYAGEAPQAVIAGVGYPAEDQTSVVKARLRDFTWASDKPHEELVAKIAGGPEGVESGGGARFLDFLDKELKPEIARRYDGDAGDAALFGHSLGGLFALNVLFVRPRSFRRYSISSPPILWADNRVLETEKAYARENADIPARVLLAVGGEETTLAHVLGLPEEMKQVEKDFVDAMGAPNPLAQVSAFYETLAGRSYPHLDLDFRIFEGESHTSAAPAVFLKALRTLFSAPSSVGR